MNEEKCEKIENIVFIVLIVILIAVFTAVIFILIDFKNDYDCATTTDVNWYIEHDCERYER